MSDIIIGGYSSLMSEKIVLFKITYQLEVHNMKIEEKLAELGLTLPQVPAPVAAYVPAVKAGRWVYVSGHIALLLRKHLR